MPVYLHIANLIVDKKAVEQKYKGGLHAFREKYFQNEDELNEEDDELFSIVSMDIPDALIDQLLEGGLACDYKNRRSEDFTVYLRYGGLSWPEEWLEENGVYGWHADCPENQIVKANEIANTPLEKILELSEQGIEPYITITKDTI